MFLVLLTLTAKTAQVANTPTEKLKGLLLTQQILAKTES